MKQTIILALLTGTTMLASAQETGRVISSTPVVTQVGVPRQVCSTQAVPVQSQKSGAGAIMGALAGGAMGSAVGGGDGRVLATMIGVIGGAMLGDRVEGPSQSQSQNVQSCSTQTFYENRTTAYNVVYEFGGKQYSVQMPNDPGPFVKLQITPVGASAPTGNSQSGQIYSPLSTNNPFNQQDYLQNDGTQIAVTQPVVQPAVVAVQPAVYAVMPASPVAPVYYGSPYVAPVGVNLNLGWTNGHHGRRHWR